MLNLLIKRILAWLAGITAEQWEYALSSVEAANAVLSSPNGAQKKAFVISEIRKHFPEIKEAALNLLNEVA